ncbi:MAG TPA: outer membrane beta-barrel family protein [Ferruginibacter sp.]|nr:outer membrane beta-barrel family protein [Ferruginibacter sp.]
MLKKFCVSLFSIFITLTALTQSPEFTGIIKDTTANKLVKNAVVAMLSQKDSTLVGFTRTKDDRTYALPKLAAGKYIFMVMHPSFADYVEDIDITTGNEKMPLVSVTPKSKLLEAVIIKSGNPIRIKGDTTIYTADSFKVSANANVEELLKKMPGIQVDKNGEIKAMGETVEKVLVDGEEFFGDDPGMAVKNLRADAIKEVQVFKKKSDQAEFTGIDDGQSKQTINLKLKEDKKTGYFGKIDAAGGLQKNIDDRYNTNLMYSSFKGKRKLSGFLLNGNTGQDGLSWQDMEKFGGNDMNFEMTDDGGMMFFSGGGGSDEEPYVNTQNGFINNVNAGLQYNNKFSDKNTLNISPKFNSQVYDNNKINFVQTQLKDSILNENSATQTHVNRTNYKTNASYDMKLDSNNSLKLSLNANVYHTESEEQRSSVTTGESGNLKNMNDRISNLSSDKQSFGGSALFKHKFKKNRRTLSINADYKMLNTDAGNFIKQDFRDYSPGSINTESNQFTDIDKSTNSITTKVVYTEPLGKKFSLELGHEVSVNNGKNNQSTFSYTPATGKFDEVVDSLSNHFDQTIITNRPSAKISFADKKIKYNVGLGVGFTQFDLKDVTYNIDYDRNYTNFFPTAMFTYSSKANSSIRFNYNGRTTQPTLNQLQPLRNNNDQFNQYIGNPDLKQSFSNTFNLSKNNYNFLKEKYTYVSINANFTTNAITNNRDINPVTGYTVTQPINTNGNMNIGLWSGMGIKFKKADLRLNIGPNLNYRKFADVINGVTNYTKNLNAGANLSLSKSKDKKYDISLQNNYSYNRNKNSVSFNSGKEGNVSFFSTNTLSSEVTVYYKKVWSVNTDYDFYYRQKTSQFTNDLSNHLWNAKLQRTFKKNEFTAYLQVRDLLNQNIGVDRSFNGITYREERNDRLKRYWMLGFKWDFKNKPPKAKEEVKK